MKYYQCGEKLVQFNQETGVYRVRNSIDKQTNILTKEQFESMNPVQAKHNRFCELVNNYFRDVKHSWEYDNTRYRKLDNFDKDGNSCGMSYFDMPKHEVEGSYYEYLQLVYHCGRVYYMTTRGNDFPQCQLIDIKTLRILQWTNIKNLAPVFNETEKKII